MKGDTGGAVVGDLPVTNKYVELRTGGTPARPARVKVDKGQHEDLRESPARLTRTGRRRSARSFEPVVDHSGDAAFEAAQGAVAAVAFGDAALVVGLAGAVVDGLGESDAVDRGVEAAVAVAGRAESGRL